MPTRAQRQARIRVGGIGSVEARYGFEGRGLHAQAEARSCCGSCPIPGTETRSSTHPQAGDEVRGARSPNRHEISNRGRFTGREGDGGPFSGLFLVPSKDVREGKTGRKYMSLTLMDRTGEIDARACGTTWRRPPGLRTRRFRARGGGGAGVPGQAPVDRPQAQAGVRAERSIHGTICPRRSATPKEMFAELKAIIGGFRNPH